MIRNIGYNIFPRFKDFKILELFKEESLFSSFVFDGMLSILPVTIGGAQTKELYFYSEEKPKRWKDEVVYISGKNADVEWNETDWNITIPINEFSNGVKHKCFDTGTTGNTTKFVRIIGLDISKPFTISALFRKNVNNSSINSYISISDDEYDNRILVYENDKFYIILNQKAGQTANPFTISNSLLEIGKWYHIVLTYDGNILSVYVNGIKFFSTEVSFKSYSHCLYFAQDQDSYNGGLASNQCFLGKISDIRIFSRCLSEEEIKKLTDYELPRPNYFFDDFEKFEDEIWTDNGVDSKTYENSFLKLTNNILWEEEEQFFNKSLQTKKTFDLNKGIRVLVNLKLLNVDSDVFFFVVGNDGKTMILLDNNNNNIGIWDNYHSSSNYGNHVEYQGKFGTSWTSIIIDFINGKVRYFDTEGRNLSLETNNLSTYSSLYILNDVERTSDYTLFDSIAIFPVSAKEELIIEDIQEETGSFALGKKKFEKRIKIRFNNPNEESLKDYPFVLKPDDYNLNLVFFGKK